MTISTMQNLIIYMISYPLASIESDLTRQVDPHVEDLGVVGLRLVHGEVDAPLQPPELRHVPGGPPDGALHEVVTVDGGAVGVRGVADIVDKLAVVEHLCTDGRDKCRHMA